MRKAFAWICGSTPYFLSRMVCTGAHPAVGSAGDPDNWGIAGTRDLRTTGGDRAAFGDNPRLGDVKYMGDREYRGDCNGGDLRKAGERR